MEAYKYTRLHIFNHNVKLCKNKLYYALRFLFSPEYKMSKYDPELLRKAQNAFESYCVKMM